MYVYKILHLPTFSLVFGVVFKAKYYMNQHFLYLLFLRATKIVDVKAVKG